VAVGAQAELCVPCDEPAGAVHSIGVQTCTLRARGRFALEPLKRWLCELLWERPELTVYRMKGVLHVAGDARVHVLQAVHEVWDLKACEGVAEEGEEDDTRGPANQLVVIAASVDAEALEREWLACMSPVKE
jgi:G3E family GTPase